MRKIIILVAVFMVCLVLGSGAIAQTNKFWALDVGNQWDFQGNCGPFCSYTSHDLVTGIDSTTFPFSTYLIQYTFSGSLLPDYEWYTFSDTELRIWRIQDWDDADQAYSTIDMHNGVTWAKNPGLAGDSWNSITTGTFTVGNLAPISINVNVNSVVEAYGPVIVPLGTFNAYKIRHDILIPELGSFIQNFWVIPYFGVVKREETGIDGTDIESLTGMNIATVFTDAPFNHWAYHYIMGIYNDGITLGTTPGAYSPLMNVTREQMAAFLVRAKMGGQFFEGPCTGPSPFSDVPQSSNFCRNIEQLVTLGITRGCGDGTTYCPSATVNREQMAAFIVRAVMNGQFFEGQCTGPSPFTDVLQTSPFCKNIERLTTFNPPVTLGCKVVPVPEYCPGNNVLRDQMAAFLARAFLGLQ